MYSVCVLGLKNADGFIVTLFRTGKKHESFPEREREREKMRKRRELPSLMRSHFSLINEQK